MKIWADVEQEKGDQFLGPSPLDHWRRGAWRANGSDLMCYWLCDSAVPQHSCKEFPYSYCPDNRQMNYGCTSWRPVDVTPRLAVYLSVTSFIATTLVQLITLTVTISFISKALFIRL
jgi:hypothetical protein